MDHLNSHISFLSPMALIVHVVRLRYPGVELLLAVQRTKQLSKREEVEEQTITLCYSESGSL